VKRDINTIFLARSSGTCPAAVLHKGKRNGRIKARRHNKRSGRRCTSGNAELDSGDAPRILKPKNSGCVPRISRPRPPLQCL